jgi:hypothetical protein
MPNRMIPGPKTDRRRQHDAERDFVEPGLGAVEDRLCDEENPDVEDDQPAKNTTIRRLSRAESMRLLIVGPAVPFVVLTIAVAQHCVGSTTKPT